MDSCFQVPSLCQSVSVDSGSGLEKLQETESCGNVFHPKIDSHRARFVCEPFRSHSLPSLFFLCQSSASLLLLLDCAIMPTRQRRKPGLDDPIKVSLGAFPSASELPQTTQWYRAHGRQSREEKAAKQQYLTPQEEKALVQYVLRLSRNGYPVPVKLLRSLAFVIRCQRSSIFQVPAAEAVVQLPGKNWPQGFYKRHPELQARRMKALDWTRHEHTIYDKVVDWFTVIGKELSEPAILQKNVYNMDETGVLLGRLGSLKVLVGRDELRNYRGAGVQRTLITAIECISADGRFLDPLIIWPAATHRSNWTVHPTPGWHFACSKTGYTDAAISLYWIQHVFDPLTKARANGKPRMLISDGFGTHETLEILKYCFENNIILCRLPSHTSHKLQPCDISVFGPLKAAYRVGSQVT